MKTRLIPLIVLCAVASGCAAIPYVPPPDPDAATVTFHNMSDTPIQLFGFVLAEDCSGGRVAFGSPDLAPGETREIKVYPDELFSFVFHYRAGELTCSTPVTFYARENGRYTAAFKDDASTCFFGVFVDRDGRERPELSFRARKSIMPNFEKSARCE
jgi:hypothetical protein